MSKKTSKMTVQNVEKVTGNGEIYADLFQIVKQNNVYFIGIANKLISRNSFATAKEAKAYIDSKPWELIINVSCLCMDLSKQTELQKKTNSEQQHKADE